MFGDIIDTFIQVLRNSEVVTTEKMSVCVISSDEAQTVNTPPPAIAIGIEDSLNADVFIGGAVKDRLRIKLCVMVNISNYSWTKDRDFQANLISLGRRTRNAIERAKSKGEFVELQRKYNLWPIYKGFKTYQRISTREALNADVMVNEIIYESTVLDMDLLRENNPTEEIKKLKIKGFSGTKQDQTTELPPPWTPDPPVPGSTRNFTCRITVTKKDGTLQKNIDSITCDYVDYNGKASVTVENKNPADLVLSNIEYNDQFVFCTVVSTAAISSKQLFIPKGTTDEVKEYNIGEWK